LRQLPPRKRTQAVTFGPRYSMRDEWNRPDKPFRKRDIETKKRTVAISMLVDCSGSMGNLMPGVREAVLSTYLASVELGVPVEVRAFSSWQRNPAPVIVGFGDSSNTAPEQIAGLAAIGGTMLASPLRIAGGELAKRREQHKVLLVLHDGEPGDEDESRMAILQLKRKVNVIGVYLGQPSERANADLRELFGRHLVVAETPEQLMTLLGAFIVKMVAPY
jgi:Mg-chelatase subunit ChlD